jgi:hypothetical protein
MMYVRCVRCPTVELLRNCVIADSKVLPRRYAVNGNCNSVFSYSFGQTSINTSSFRGNSTVEISNVEHLVSYLS